MTARQAPSTSRIDRWLDALAVAFESAGEIVPWPLHLGEVMPYCGDLEVRDLLDAIAHLDAENASDADVAALFVGASSPKSLLTDIVFSMKIVGVETDERVAFVERIFDAMAATEPGDIFCGDGRHLVLPAGDAQALADAALQSGVEAGAPDLAAFYRFSGAAQTAVWACLFYGWTDIGFETHGPYDVCITDGGAPAQLLVRDFYDLRPQRLWPDLDGPAATARFVTVHDPAAGLAVDIFNHPTHAAPLRTSTLAASLEVDGETIDAPGAAVLTKVLVERAKSRQARIDEMDRADVVQTFVASRYYALRRWRRVLGREWAPPDAVAERIRTWEPIAVPATQKQDVAGLLAAFDPRTSTV